MIIRSCSKFHFDFLCLDSSSGHQKRDGAGLVMGDKGQMLRFIVSLLGISAVRSSFEALAAEKRHRFWFVTRSCQNLRERERQPMLRHDFFVLECWTIQLLHQAKEVAFSY